MSDVCGVWIGRVDLFSSGGNVFGDSLEGWNVGRLKVGRLEGGKVVKWEGWKVGRLESGKVEGEGWQIGDWTSVIFSFISTLFALLCG